MRFKYILLSLMLIILVTSVTAIAAADDYESLGDYTFDIPDGYQVVDKTDEMVTMQADDNHSVIVYALDKSDDVDVFKSLLEDLGCEFGDEDSFQSGSFDVRQSSYKYLDTQGYVYACNDGGSPILIALGIPQSEELPSADNNTAREVVDSLE